MRLIDADALKENFGDWYIEEGTEEGFIGCLKDLLDRQPTVDAVPVTDVDKLKMRLIGAVAAVNGMREQINRMVILNSEKVSGEGGKTMDDLMYDELVKRLRTEAKCPDNYPEDSDLMREAADAIEDLMVPRGRGKENR